MKRLIALVLSLAPAFAAGPVYTDFGWANQGACIGAQNPSGSLTLFHPGAPSLGFNWCVLAKALPAAPYTIIIKHTGSILDKAASLGIHLYESSTGKFVVYSLPGSSDNGTNSIAAWKMNSFTSYNGAYFTYSNGQAFGGLLAKRVRLKDSGTFRTLAISTDDAGEVWLTIGIWAHSDFITPDYFGYALRGAGNSAASIMTIESEAITTP